MVSDMRKTPAASPTARPHYSLFSHFSGRPPTFHNRRHASQPGHKPPFAGFGAIFPPYDEAKVTHPFL